MTFKNVAIGTLGLTAATLMQPLILLFINGDFRVETFLTILISTMAYGAGWLPALVPFEASSSFRDMPIAFLYAISLAPFVIVGTLAYLLLSRIAKLRSSVAIWISIAFSIFILELPATLFLGLVYVFGE